MFALLFFGSLRRPTTICSNVLLLLNRSIAIKRQRINSRTRIRVKMHMYSLAAILYGLRMSHRYQGKRDRQATRNDNATQVRKGRSKQNAVQSYFFFPSGV